MAQIQVKSKQSGFIAIDTSLTSAAATITSVDTTKTIVQYYLSATGGLSEIRRNFYVPDFLNSTTLRFYKSSPSSVASTLFWEVIEFTSGCTVRVGKYTDNLSYNVSGVLGANTIRDITVSSVDTTKAFVWGYGGGDNGENGAGAPAPRSYLTSNTNLRIDQPFGGDIGYDGGTGYVTFMGQIPVFDDATVQYVSGALTTATSQNISIPTPVDLSKSFIVGSVNAISANVRNSNTRPIWRIADSSTITVERNTSSSPTSNQQYGFYIVTVSAGLRVQRGQTSLSAGYVTVPLTSAITTSASIIKIGGVQHSLPISTATELGQSQLSIPQIVDANTISFKHNASATGAKINWEVLDFGYNPSPFTSSVGFVSVAPTINPNGNNNDIGDNGYNNGTGGFISPSGNNVVSELGFWTTTADGSVNYQIGLYVNSGTDSAVSGSPIASGSGTISANSGSWFRVTINPPVQIQPSTSYGIVVAITSASTVGLGGNDSYFSNSWFRYINNDVDGQLLSPWPGGGIGDTRTLAYYALYSSAVPTPLSAWNRRCKITINKNNICENLTDFPVWLNQNTVPSEMLTSGGLYACKADGSDIRITTDSSGTIECPVEVAYISLSSDPTQSKLELYTRIPSISTTANTEFYIWYNSPAATAYASSATYGRNNVWSNGYVGVWHLNNSVVDSTSAGTTSTVCATFNSNSASYMGIGYYSFNGSNQYIQLTAASAMYSMTDLTVEGWGYQSAAGEGDSWLLDYDYTGYRIWSDRSTDAAFSIRDPSGGWSSLGSCPASGTWQYLAGTYTKSNARQTEYLSGSFVTSATAGTYTFGSFGSNTLCFGAHQNTNNTWAGYLDEIRVSRAARSSCWVSATYANTKTPTSFLSAGSSESTETHGTIKFWISGAGSWYDASHWALASSGTAAGGIPNSADNVVFDGGSVGTATLTSAISVSGIIFSGATSAALTTTTSNYAIDCASLAMTAGTISANGSDINVAGNWSIMSGATFNPQTSNIIFDSGGNVIIYYQNNSAQFYNLQVLKNSGVTLSANLTATNLTVTSGDFNQNGYTITLWDGFSGTTPGTITMNSATTLSGNFILGNSTTFSGANSTITFNGAAAQILSAGTMSAGNVEFCNIVANQQVNNYKDIRLVNGLLTIANNKFFYLHPVSGTHSDIYLRGTGDVVNMSAGGFRGDYTGDGNQGIVYYELATNGGTLNIASGTGYPSSPTASYRASALRLRLVGAISGTFNFTGNIDNVDNFGTEGAGNTSANSFNVNFNNSSLTVYSVFYLGNTGNEPRQTVNFGTGTFTVPLFLRFENGGAQYNLSSANFNVGYWTVYGEDGVGPAPTWTVGSSNVTADSVGEAWQDLPAEKGNPTFNNLIFNNASATVNAYTPIIVSGTHYIAPTTSANYIDNTNINILSAIASTGNIGVTFLQSGTHNINTPVFSGTNPYQVYLRSSVEGSQWTWIPTNDATVYYVNVKDSNLTVKTYNALDESNTNAGNNTLAGSFGWLFTSIIPIVINYFSASPSAICLGNSSVLAWSVSGTSAAIFNITPGSYSASVYSNPGYVGNVYSATTFSAGGANYQSSASTVVSATSVVIPQGYNRVLVLAAGKESNAVVSTNVLLTCATYGDKRFILADRISGTNGTRYNVSEIWYLPCELSGIAYAGDTQNVSAFHPLSACESSMILFTISGVSQTPHATGKGYLSSNTVSATVNGVSANSILVEMNTTNNPPNINIVSATTQQTKILEYGINTFDGFDSYAAYKVVSAAGNYTEVFSASNSSRTTLAVAAFAPALTAYGTSSVSPTSSTTYILSAWIPSSANNYISSNLSAWSTVSPITIDSTKYSGNINNFPVYLAWGGSSATSNIPINAINNTTAKSDGSDIRFTSDLAGTTELPFDIAIFSANSVTSAAYAEIFVKYNLSAGTNSTIYMWYGNSAASAYANSATYGKNNVWTPSYGVWHMKESTGTLVLDSAGGNQGYYVSNLPNLVSAQFYSQSANGSTGWIYTTSSFANPTVYTYQTWFKTSTSGMLMSFGNSQSGTPGSYDRHLYVDNNGKLRYGIYPGSTQYLVTTASVNDGSFHMASVVQSGADYYMYLDGVYQSSASNGPPQNYTGWFRIFQGNTGGWSNANGSLFYLNGLMWNPCILSGAKTTQEISAIYNSQYDPASFAQTGTTSANAYTTYSNSYSTSATATITVTVCGVTYYFRGIWEGVERGIWVGIG